MYVLLCEPQKLIPVAQGLEAAVSHKDEAAETEVEPDPGLRFANSCNNSPVAVRIFTKLARPQESFGNFDFKRKRARTAQPRSKICLVLVPGGH
jgi:hypothetical protein